MRHIELLFVLALSAGAASNRTVTVKASGGDYTSLAAAIAGEKGDMVSLDRQLTIECYAFGDAGGRVNITNADWVTDATRYILITAPTAERHAGVWNEAKYHLEVAGAAMNVHSTEFVRIDGVQMYSTGDNPTFYAGGPDSGAGEIRISNSIIRSTSSRGGGAFLATYTGGTGFVVLAWNNLIYGATKASAGMGIRTDVTGTYSFWNNTIAECNIGVYRANGSVILKNTLFTGVTTTGTGILAAGTDYNRTSAASLGYTVTGGGNTHDAVSQTFTFADSVNKDWHLHESDAGARDRGVGDAGSGMYSSDVDGETRYGTWDVGADEYPSAARRRNAIVAWAREIQWEKE
jgi:hypothetical protein